MSSAFTIYGDRISGNCLKVKWTADYLGIETTWQDVSVVAGETRTPEFLALNPDGRVPTMKFPDGRILTESNAIILYLATGSSLIPKDDFTRARMLQWMFWEQYSHEPYIAVRRFQLAYLHRPVEELDPRLLERGNKALQAMQRQLATSPFMTGDDLTLADIALVAYTRVAHEGGFDLAAFPAVAAWVIRVERALRIASESGEMKTAGR